MDSQNPYLENLAMEATTEYEMLLIDKVKSLRAEAELLHQEKAQLGVKVEKQQQLLNELRRDIRKEKESVANLLERLAEKDKMLDLLGGDE